MQKLSFYFLIMFFSILLSSIDAQKLSYRQREALKRQESNLKEIERDRLGHLRFFTEIVKNPEAFKQQQTTPAQLEEWIRNWKQLNEKLENIADDLAKNQCPDSDADVVAINTKLNPIRENLYNALKMIEAKKNPSTQLPPENPTPTNETKTEPVSEEKQNNTEDFASCIREIIQLQNKLDQMIQTFKDAQDPKSKALVERVYSANESLARTIDILEGKATLTETEVPVTPKNTTEKQPETNIQLDYRQKEAVKRQERNISELEGQQQMIDYCQNILQDPEAFKKTTSPLKDLQQSLHNIKSLNNKLEIISSDLKKNKCPDQHPAVATINEKITKYNSLFSSTINILQERINTEIAQAESQNPKQPEATVQLGYQQKETLKRQERNMAEVEGNQQLIEYCQSLSQNSEAFKKKSYPIQELQQTIYALDSLNRKLESITSDLKNNNCPSEHPAVATLQEKSKNYNLLFSNSLNVLQEVLKQETDQLQAQEEIAQQLLERQKTFINECRPYWPSIEKFNPSKKEDWTYGTLQNRTEKFQQCITDFVALESLIKTKYADLSDPVGGHFTSEYEKPSLYRKALEQYREDGNRIAEIILNSAYEPKLKFIKEKMATVEKHSAGGTGIYCYHESNEANSADTVDIVFNKGQKTLEQLKKAIQQLYQPLGKSPETSKLLPEMDKAIEDARKAFHANLPVVSATFPYHEAKIEAFCKSYIEKTIPGAIVVQTGVLEEGWKISKNALDIPECRLKWAGVVFKETQTGLYAYSGLQYAEDYSGGGQYNSSGRISSLYGAVFGYSYCKGE
ncbi:MAG: hypothetical protein AABZ60_23780 [Planctomycetota bacterium]